MKTQAKIWVTPTTELLAYELIGKLKIHRGRRIAPYLSLPEQYSNYEAVKLWVERVLAEHHPRALQLQELSMLFQEAIPTNMHGVID